MYKLLKVAIVMLALAVYTSADIPNMPSNCKCRNHYGEPVNDPTEHCCSYNPSTNYGCPRLHYSGTHNRCDCSSTGLVDNVDQWATCCSNQGQSFDESKKCVVG